MIRAFMEAFARRAGYILVENRPGTEMQFYIEQRPYGASAVIGVYGRNRPSLVLDLDEDKIDELIGSLQDAKLQAQLGVH